MESILSPQHTGAGPVFVLATTIESTRRAFEVARALGHDRHAAIRIVTAPREKITVSSARAHVHDIEVDWDPEPSVSDEFLRALIETDGTGARLIVGPSMEPSDIAAVLPSHATVVLGGPVRRFFESSEQRLARTLTHAGCDVVFVPCGEAHG
jgi:hypothetical protein